MALRQDIDACSNVALDMAGCSDYGPNGLQVPIRRYSQSCVIPGGR